MARKVKAKKSTATSRRTATRAAAMPQLPMTNFTQLILATITFWLANSIILLVANMVAPRDVVLGTHLISTTMAALYAGGTVALVGVSAIPVIEFLSAEMKMRLSNLHWMLIYLVLNTGGIWLAAQFSEVLGMGIKAWWVAVVLGLIFDMVQGWLMTAVISKKK